MEMEKIYKELHKYIDWKIDLEFESIKYDINTMLMNTAILRNKINNLEEKLEQMEQKEQANYIKFIDYTGKYPCLCAGVLTIEFRGKEYKMENILESGGAVYFTNDYEDAHVELGPWTIDKESLPEELQPYLSEIIKLVNKNVPNGCCGGCI